MNAWFFASTISVLTEKREGYHGLKWSAYFSGPADARSPSHQQGHRTTAGVCVCVHIMSIYTRVG